MNFLALGAGALVAGCGGSSDAPATGPLTVQVVDAPVDPATIDRVCITFNAVTVHYAGNDDVRLAYEPAPSQVSPETHCTAGWNGEDPVPPVRLDALSGALTVSLVDSLQLQVGRITWIRLHFTDGSYVVDNVGQHPLNCPSCEATDNNQNRGFKLNRTFEMTSNGLSLLVDIDLNRSLIKENANGYVLRPTARVERNELQGTIAGQVADTVITALGGTAFIGGDVDTGCHVYVYPDDGSDIDDFHYDGSNVVTTATVRFRTTTGDYSYAAGGLPVEDGAADRNYRVALTCDIDDSMVDDDGTGVMFTDPVPVTVEAGMTSTVDFD